MQCFHSTELCHTAHGTASCVQPPLPSADGRKVDLTHLEMESVVLRGPVCSDWSLAAQSHLPMPAFAVKIMLKIMLSNSRCFRSVVKVSLEARDSAGINTVLP